jgi:hypothetical protein
MNRHRNAFAVILAALLAVTVLAPAASAEHERRYDRSRDREHVARLAHDLENASHDAYRLAARRGRGDHQLDAAFARMRDAAAQFHRTVESGRYDARDTDRAFDLVADRYYRLRGEFGQYHGPRDLRTAFHRINEPMERLYRTYTGRDLYRDDPYARSQGRYDDHDRYGRYDDHGRYDDRGRHDDGRGRDGDRGGAVRTRVPRRH